MVQNIDPALFAKTDGEDPNGPLIKMVVSLGFPDMNFAASCIQTDTTILAFEAVRLAGGRPRLVEYTTGKDLTPIAEVISDADGIVFLGGADVDPATYGYNGELLSKVHGIDRRADEYCIDLFHAAAAKDITTLAICRGSQVMNVAFGGTLIPDIANWEMHKGDGNPLFIDEEVLLEQGTKIAEIMGQQRLTVRNGHHQAVDQVADALVATAYAHDGIVEGTEHRTATWMVGVQWHPEEPGGSLADRDRLFAAFVTQAAG